MTAEYRCFKNKECAAKLEICATMQLVSFSS